jgi:hypothetical protein
MHIFVINNIRFPKGTRKRRTNESQRGQKKEKNKKEKK